MKARNLKELRNMKCRLSGIGGRLVDCIRRCNGCKSIGELFQNLGELSMKDGYVIDAFCKVDSMGGCTVPYAHRKFAYRMYRPIDGFEYYDCFSDEYGLFSKKKPPEVAPYQDNLIIPDKLAWWMADCIPDYQEYVVVPWTETGIWQAFLLWDMSPTLELFWHGGYMEKKYVFSDAYLEKLAKDKEGNIFGDPDISINIRQQKGNPKLEPQVRIFGDVAFVRHASWNDWSGLVVSEVRCCRVGDGVRFDKRDCRRETLVEFDCGIRF